ncbi:hypothetical protein B296_00047771, partial [Ensete ventricosum]
MITILQKKKSQRSLAFVRECSALFGHALALAIGAGDDRVGSVGRFLLYDRSASNSSVEGRRSVLRSAIPGGESVISGMEGRQLFSPRHGTDSRARNGGGCTAIGAGFTVALRSCGNSSMERATAASAIDVESATAATLRPALVASQRNAPLQQSQRERVAPQPLVTSQREEVAPLQQQLVTPQQLRPVSHQDVPPLISSRRDAPSMNQARGHSRSRSRPPSPISRDPRPWSSLFKALVDCPDLRLDFLAPEVQADQKIALYEAIDSDELIQT